MFGLAALQRGNPVSDDADLADGKLPTAAQRAYEQELWLFNVKSGVERLERLEEFARRRPARQMPRLGHVRAGGPVLASGPASAGARCAGRQVLL
jgi:hypothetical protein